MQRFGDNRWFTEQTQSPGTGVIDMHEDLRIPAVALSLALLGLPALAAAQDKTQWTATSTTAMAITGDIVVSDNAVTFGDGKEIAIEPIGGGPAYKLSEPDDPVLLNGNRLCGSGKPVGYVIFVRPSENSLSMSVFDGDKAPQGDNDSPCAVYNYER